MSLTPTPLSIDTSFLYNLCKKTTHFFSISVVADWPACTGTICSNSLWYCEGNQCRVRWTKKGEECCLSHKLIKDGIFFRLFCLANPVQDKHTELAISNADLLQSGVYPWKAHWKLLDERTFKILSMIVLGMHRILIYSDVLQCLVNMK
jgi:hypothetical protein